MAEPDTNLESLEGVGPATADTLRVSDINSVTDVATADRDVLADALDDIPGITDEKLDEIQSTAITMTADLDDEDLDEIADEIDTNSDTEATETAEEPTTEDAGAETPDQREVTVSATSEVCIHVIKGVLDEAVRMRQRNRFDDEATLNRIATELMAQYDPPEEWGNGSHIELTFTVSQNELDDVHQAISALVSNYRAKNGISSLWGDIQLVHDQLQDAREQFWD